MDVGDVVAEKFEVRRVLEVGGRSTLFEALELEHGNFAVLEVFRPFQLTDMHEPFLRELRLVAQMAGEHLARVFDSGIAPDGCVYVLSEPREGESLEALLRREGPQPLIRIAALMVQVCDALDEAHAVHVVHQDLSPETLFLTRRADGSSCMKVREFGARLATIAITDGRMFGMPRYTAPDQLAPASDVDQRTDIWAIGATLYELASGRRPFEQPESQLEAALLTTDPTSLGTLRPGLPGAFVDVVMRCLARDPQARYATAVELADALAPYGPGRGRGVSGTVRNALTAGATRLKASSDAVLQRVRPRRS